MMLVGKCLVVIGSVGPCPCIALAIYAADTIYIIRVDDKRTLYVIVLAVLDAEIRLDGKPLDRLDFKESVAEDAP